MSNDHAFVLSPASLGVSAYFLAACYLLLTLLTLRKLRLVSRATTGWNTTKLFVGTLLVASFIRTLSFITVCILTYQNVALSLPEVHSGMPRDYMFFAEALEVLFTMPVFLVVSAFLLLGLVMGDTFLESRRHWFSSITLRRHALRAYLVINMLVYAVQLILYPLFIFGTSLPADVVLRAVYVAVSTLDLAIPTLLLFLWLLVTCFFSGFPLESEFLRDRWLQTRNLVLCWCCVRTLWAVLSLVGMSQRMPSGLYAVLITLMLVVCEIFPFALALGANLSSVLQRMNYRSIAGMQRMQYWGVMDEEQEQGEHQQQLQGQYMQLEEQRQRAASVAPPLPSQGAAGPRRQAASFSGGGSQGMLLATGVARSAAHDATDAAVPSHAPRGPGVNEPAKIVSLSRLHLAEMLRNRPAHGGTYRATLVRSSGSQLVAARAFVGPAASLRATLSSVRSSSCALARLSSVFLPVVAVAAIDEAGRDVTDQSPSVRRAGVAGAAGAAGKAATLWVATPFMPQGSLASLLLSPADLPWRTRITIALQVADALARLTVSTAPRAEDDGATGAAGRKSSVGSASSSVSTGGNATASGRAGLGAVAEDAASDASLPAGSPQPTGLPVSHGSLTAGAVLFASLQPMQVRLTRCCYAPALEWQQQQRGAVAGQDSVERPAADGKQLVWVPPEQRDGADAAFCVGSVGSSMGRTASVDSVDDMALLAQSDPALLPRAGDVYRMGVLLVALATRCLPPPIVRVDVEADSGQRAGFISLAQLARLVSLARLNKDAAGLLVALIRDCLHPSPLVRPAMRNVAKELRRVARRAAHDGPA